MDSQLPRRLTSLGSINYRNIGLAFVIAVLMEMRKELDSRHRQYKDIEKAEQALSVVLNNLPDAMTEEQVNIGCLVFLEMEKLILRYSGEYKVFMTDMEKEELYEMFNEITKDGSDYI